VLNEAYATKIARGWNTKDAASGFVGYVLRFESSAPTLTASRYASFLIDGTPRDSGNWPDFTNGPPWDQSCSNPTNPPCVHYHDPPVDAAAMEAMSTNASNVARTICVVRD
jgi:hypothetical protein